MVNCHSCGAPFIVEFDPSDDPGLRARIERLDVDEDGGEPLHWNLVHLRETMRRAHEMRRDAIGLRNAIRHWRMLQPLAERNLPIDLDGERETFKGEHTDLRNEHLRLHADPFDLDAHRKHRLKLAAHAARITRMIRSRAVRVASQVNARNLPT